MAGRPTDCTPETIAEVCKWLASGCYVETACGLAGISETTYYKWKRLGDDGEEPYAQFVQEVTRAEQQAEARAVALINKAGEEDPRNLQWWLARRHSKRWADVTKQQVTGADGGPVKIAHEGAATLLLLQDPEACALASQLVARLSDPAMKADDEPDRPDG